MAASLKVRVTAGSVTDLLEKIISKSGSGDEGKITIGNNSNLQDGTVVKASTSTIGGSVTDTNIGNDVTIGHNATLRACSIADASLIGMDATILEGVQVSLRVGTIVHSAVLNICIFCLPLTPCCGS